MVCGRELAAKVLVYSRVPDLCSSEQYMNSPVKLWFSIKLIAIEYFSKPWNCWMAIFNSILKIRQNQFGETWEKLSIKIFNFHHRKPNVKTITNSDTLIIVCFLFFSELFSSLMYCGYFCFLKKTPTEWVSVSSWRLCTGYSATRLSSHSVFQVSILFLWRYLKGKLLVDLCYHGWKYKQLIFFAEYQKCSKYSSSFTGLWFFISSSMEANRVDDWWWTVWFDTLFTFSQLLNLHLYWKPATKYVQRTIALYQYCLTYSHFCDPVMFKPWTQWAKYLNVVSQCLTKPRFKSFPICPTILSKHHLLWTVFWKHIEKTRKTFIFLKQPTKEETWRFKDSLNRGLS